MRRERAHAVDELRRGPRRIELAVGGDDLLRVRHALVRLRRERWMFEHAVEQSRGNLGRARVHDAGVVLRADVERFLCGDRPGVELLRRAVDGDSRLRVAGHDRALDGSGAAPARQERRMHVQP